jgi:hypothetical protein
MVEYFVKGISKRISKIDLLSFLFNIIVKIFSILFFISIFVKLRYYR